MARELTILVDIDTAGATTSLRNMDRLVGDTARSMSERLTSFGTRTARIGGAITAGIGLPLAAIGGSLLKLGTDAAESEDLFTRAFGEMADSARAWSEGVADATAGSAFALREQSAIMFAMVQSFGLTKEAAFTLATGVSELGQDFESLFNLAEGEGFSKLRAGLIGEIEPLRSIGISFSAADVKARAYADGIAEVGTELTESQKVLSRWAIINDQASLAQGNAAATAESEANQLRDLKTELADNARELGIALLPALNDFLSAARDLIPLVTSAVTWFTNLSPEVRKTGVVITGLVVAIGPIVLAFGTLVAAVGAFVAAVGVPVAAAVAGVVGTLALAGAAVASLIVWWEQFGQKIPQIVSQTVQSVRTWLVDQFGAIVESVKGKIDAVTGFFQGMFDTVVGNSIVPDMVNQIGVHMNRLTEVMVAPAQSAIDGVLGKFSGAFGGDGILSSVMSGGMDIMGNLMNQGMQVLQNLAARGLQWIGGKFKELFGGPSAEELAGREIVEQFQGNIAQMLDETQNLEAGGELWKQVNIGVRDSYQDVGLSEQEALADLQRLYDAIKGGPAEVNPIIAEITAKMGGLTSEIQAAASAFSALGNASVPSVPSFGGAMAAGGAGTVTRPTLFLAGEAGPEQFAFSGANRTFGGGSTAVTINLQGAVIANDASMDALSNQIAQSLTQRLRSERRLGV